MKSREEDLQHPAGFRLDNGEILWTERPAAVLPQWIRLLLP